MASDTRVEYCNAAGRDFLQKARAYLADGDLLQASEKGWGAAAQMVKAAAGTRGWRHQDHRSLYEAVDRLARGTGDASIRTGSSEAGALHTKFYEGWLPRETVEHSLSQVAELVDKLAALRG